MNRAKRRVRDLINPYSTAFASWWCHAARYWRLSRVITGNKTAARPGLPRPAVPQDIPDERFCPCPAGRHWGPRGAAGILPCAVAHDGGVWVLLSHRSPHVQRGGTWSTFGGAIDVGESAWQAAVRETCEEIRGITPDQAGIAGEWVWECPQGCGWTYTTFAVRVPLHSGGSLPRARVAPGRAAWETAGLAWVPVSQVQGAGRDLHPSFADAWPALRQVISGPRSARSPES